MGHMDMPDHQLYGTATVGTKGQVVIPSDARDALGIQPGDKLYVAGMKGKKILAFIPEEELQVIVEKMLANVESYKKIIKK